MDPYKHVYKLRNLALKKKKDFQSTAHIYGRILPNITHLLCAVLFISAMACGV